MGWNISHGNDFFGEERRSYTNVHHLGQQLAHVLTGADWSVVSFLFTRRSGDPFDVDPALARAVAVVLHRGSEHKKMPREWAREANAFALAAGRAAEANEPWVWR
ncbi:hypothetical protein [Streptomyces sp. NPDC006638]|uniref:DUF7739 domain-containing protein n=1 Tax=Streptomyces sp. NPDC006638 TaxID=3157183 RepID=UPI0033B3B981